MHVHMHNILYIGGTYVRIVCMCFVCLYGMYMAMCFVLPEFWYHSVVLWQ